MLLLCCLLVWNSTAYAAVAPVVATLSSISEGSVTPVRIAADQSGNFYVTDPRGGGVLKYNSAGNLRQIIATTDKHILGIAVARNGDLLVSQGAVVAVYSAEGMYRSSFGAFDMANGIAVDGSGAVFVVDSKKNCVNAYAADYTFSHSFGSTGSGAGQFKQPTGITFEKVSGQLAVVDTLNGRVQFFTTAGIHQKTIGSFGAGPLKFTSPQAIAFDYSSNGTVLGRMYVVDSFQANVQVIDAASSAFLRYIGSYGVRNGQLVTPGDLLLDSFHRLVIPNGTGTLALYGIEGATSGSSGTAVSFPSSAGNAPPLLTLNTLASVSKTSAITVSGSVSPAGSSVSVNGVAASVDSSGNWSRGVALPQQGLNNIVVSASNNGSTSSVSAYVTLDMNAPVVTASSMPPTGSTTNTPILTIAGTVTDTTATSVTVSVVSGAQTISRTVPVNDGVFTTAVVLATGANTITVSATDAAGSTSSSSSTVTYKPLASAITVTTPGNSVTGSANYSIAGTATAGSSVTITANGSSQTLTADASGRWNATVQLAAGLNSLGVTANDGRSGASTLASSVTYAPGQPALAVTTPAADNATATSSAHISGTTDKNVSVTASLNGETVPVTVAADGSFTAFLPPFVAAGTYTAIITAIDGNGKMSTTARTFVYDPAPPQFVVVDATPASVRITSANGVVIARDRNGVVATPTNGTSSLNLTNATYDQPSLNITVLTPTGLSSRNGDINGDGVVTLADALFAAQISLGTVPAATFEQRLRGDVGPLVNHVPVPDGRIRLDDAILILQKSIGIDW
jgi:uncharacterized protein YfaP (DUF2135 family)